MKINNSDYAFIKPLLSHEMYISKIKSEKTLDKLLTITRTYCLEKKPTSSEILMRNSGYC